MTDIKSEIQAQVDKMTEVMKTKNYNDMVNFYTDDCKVMPAGAEMIVGKEGLKGFMDAMSKFADKMGKLETSLLEAYSMGDVATSISTGTVYGTDGNLMDKTKNITIWKKVNGNWHIYCACWNHDKPMPPH